MKRASAPGGALGSTDTLRDRHIPVLLPEVVESLSPADNQLIIDATFGAGGYTRAILDAAGCRVIAFDRDITAVRAAAGICAEFANRLALINQPFSQMEEFARLEESPDGAPLIAGPFVDGVVLDIGVSSMQLDQGGRGFSFQTDGPLDMRMSAAIDPLTGDTAGTGMSAADFVNTASEDAIANVIYTYGDEKKSRWIARAIVKSRVTKPLTRTLELADIVLGVFHGRKIDGRHPATRTFQALRIYVNDELGELATALAAAERILKPGGRLVVVTFHSLEDRIVKKFFNLRAGKESKGSRHLPEQSIKSAAPSFRFLNSRPLTPSKGECEVNPRARSARLRFAVRTDTPAWPLDFDELAVPQPDL
ncbi:MAG: 16S rRNA (cytosine(1402)-N(4))-methyltransferase RsmH [Hyphomicrobium sp.]|nr:16S rRNA (cytosine(1402)-N(4))-methyltransferase RsmH [Hyphomicrobium sp.]